MIFGPLAGRIINFYPRSPRGERRQAQRGQPGRKKISIHAPREGSDRYFFVVVCQCNISIHAPREGSDSFFGRPLAGAAKFLSTLPARGATAEPFIHRFPVADFYPRSPRGERRGDIYLAL